MRRGKISEVYSNNLDLIGLPSAAEGNFLEALNLTLNVFQKHHMDRDLYRTGQSVVLITAGTGIFHVDRHMVLLTKEGYTNMVLD